MKIAAVIVAAGRGLRAGGATPKQWQPLGNKRVIDHTLAKFTNHPRIDRVVVVLHADDVGLLNTSGVEHALGGATRQASVLKGLTHLAENPPDLVLIHDVARATVPNHVIDNVIDALQSHQAAAPALELTDSLWSGSNGLVTASKPRDGLYRAQTPQGFNFQTIMQAHEKKIKNALDDVQVVLGANVEVAIVAGCETNIKITLPADFQRALQIIKESTEWT